ncbi:MAG: hypothetical protein DMG10_13475 [Acidobacteria bacterium]|nr:MAG: hypothetical protein DMG10_13475 [Acidobacteriota bacterium]
MGNSRGRKRLWKTLKHRKLLSETDTGKLSGRIIELITPYREGNPDRGEFERLISLASTAWNLSLFPLKARDETMMKVLKAVPDEDRQLIRGLLQELIVRKELLFPEDRRLVGSFDVIDEGENFRVIVAALS